MSESEIVFARPSLDEEEIDAVAAVMRSGRIAQGPEVAAFEEEFASWLGASHAVAVANGTIALELALLAHGIGPRDEVIVPAFTFIATAATVSRTGATVRFCDVDPHTYCLTAEAVARVMTPATRAVVPVHLFGYPAPVDELRALSPDVLVIEDAAQAHGARSASASVGATGTATFSFYPTKNMTTGEGGMIATDDPEIADRIRLLRNHGMRDQYDYVMVGGNGRMTDIEAAIGRVQLRKLSEFLRRRNVIATSYTRELQDLDIVLPSAPYEGAHAWAVYTLQVSEREKFVRAASERGVQSRVYYPQPLHRLGLISNNDRCPEAETLADRVVSLPIRPDLDDADLARVIETVRATV